MLILTMNIGEERYGVDVTLITEVIPLVKLDRVPMVDNCILGIFNYRGIATPVIDLCYLFEQRYCERKLSSRIVIIDAAISDQQTRKIGLVAEDVTEAVKCDENNMTSSGISSVNAQFLGSVYKYKDDLIQIIDIRKILPPSITRQISSNTPATKQQSG